MTPIYITSLDRLTCLRTLVEYLAKLPGARIYIADNGSTYPPLLEWYKKECPHLGAEVIYMGGNWGPRAVYHQDLPRPKKSRFCLTDGDLDLSECPTDLLDVLSGGLDRFPNVCKVGVNERIDDLPDESPLKKYVVSRISDFWKVKVADGWWQGDVDMTFAMYRDWEPCMYGPAVRSDFPYVCRHSSWYLTPGNIPEDEFYYLNTVKKDPRHLPGAAWTPVLMNEWVK